MDDVLLLAAYVGLGMYVAVGLSSTGSIFRTDGILVGCWYAGMLLLPLV